MTTRTATLATARAAALLTLHAPCADEQTRRQRDVVLVTLLGWCDALTGRGGALTAQERAESANTLGALLAWIPTAGEA